VCYLEVGYFENGRNRFANGSKTKFVFDGSGRNITFSETKVDVEYLTATTTIGS
jgi:hypothetical protein